MDSAGAGAGDDNNNNKNDLELQEHDQLPDVEEYKAQVGYKSPGGFKVSKPDPNGFQSATLAQRQRMAEAFEAAAREETNDSVDTNSLEEPYPGGAPYDAKELIDSEARNWTICYMTAICVSLIVIAIAVPLGRRDRAVADGKYTWIKSSKRFTAIQDYLIQSTISDAGDLLDETSPQFYAAQWMAHKDGQKLDVPYLYDTEKHPTFVERYALTVIYFALGGDGWSHDLNFLSDEHICTWYQEFEVIKDDYNLFDTDYISMGVHGCKWVGDDLVPHSLYMPNNNIVGTIPNEIRELDRTEVVVLQFNNELSGTLPVGLSGMDNLRHLSLQWCGLFGTIPTWIGLMTNLSYLGLGNNDFMGDVPTELGQLTLLELLGLDDNDVAADIELFRELRNLKSLYLEDNRITGTISETLMASWPQLEEFDVSDNNLSGPLPPQFFNHENKLEVIDLHGNQFFGSIPSEIISNTKLQFLALFKNQLSEALPTTIVNFKALKHLDVSDNQLTGTLPESIAQMTTLEYLFSGSNDWDTTNMPNFLVQLKNLRELGLKNHRFTGDLPDSIHYLSNLEFLDLHFNQLTGTIPSLIGFLSNLKHLLLKRNNFVGTIPAEMDHLTKLEVLLVEQNNFTGDASVICSNDLFDISYFVADCNDDSSFSCICCTTCCDKDADTCNGGNWDASLDPIWEYGYRRFRYSYDPGYKSVNAPP